MQLPPVSQQRHYLCHHPCGPFYASTIDRGQSADVRARVILYAESISGFENVANLSALPATGSSVGALR